MIRIYLNANVKISVFCFSQLQEDGISSGENYCFVIVLTLKINTDRSQKNTSAYLGY